MFFSKQKLKYTNDYHFAESMDSLLQRRKNMATANSVIKDGDATQDRARAELKAYNAKPGERVSPRPIPISRARHLDVDAVLARSLPKVVSE